MNNQQHIPVLVKEIIELFQPKSIDTLLDATLGLGGHTAAYLRASHPDGRSVGIEADPRSLKIARANLAEFGDRVTYVEGNFANLRQICNIGVNLKQADKLKNSLPGGGIVEKNIPSKFSHILFDLGFNSQQIADQSLGFSFTSQTSINMRYGSAGPLPQSSIPAINRLTERLGAYPDAPDLIKHLETSELEEIIRLYGEERYAKRIADAIKKNFPETSHELFSVISQVVPASYQHSRINPATRTFQALRIAVNRELEVLTVALPQALELLRKDGKLAVISFHSLEDRIVKNFIRSSTLIPQNKKPIVASNAEVTKNPRSRSAKLRVAIKS
jgi:16S rRNA (cytosine1402-N4)-methyltransferase